MLKTNIIIDILAFIAFIFSALSGIVLLWIAPRGGSTFLGLLKNGWTGIHNISSMILIILVIIHIILHWNFIKNIPKCLKI